MQTLLYWRLCFLSFGIANKMTIAVDAMLFLLLSYFIAIFYANGMVYYVWYVRAFIITIWTETSADNKLIHATYGTKITHLQSHVDFLFSDYHQLAFFLSCHFTPLALSHTVVSVRMCCVVKEHTIWNINIKKKHLLLLSCLTFTFSIINVLTFVLDVPAFLCSSSLSLSHRAARLVCVLVHVIPNHRIDCSLCVKQDFTLLSFVLCLIFIGVAKEVNNEKSLFHSEICLVWMDHGNELEIRIVFFFFFFHSQAVSLSVYFFFRSLLSSARNALISVNDLITAKITQKMTVT